ncbi:autotransporter outer membrane beta-barrel domain-containing protein [Stenotrophomonas rhizophila]|uniref:autotransporter outer membrane beta-barrel domain-containing protein n=1 Tax=Stenotrophomonas rhizophila TaxID=216778 RepID=UPI001E619405|nr:autotransporter outer membrane beta-barrel domain-containing protein [Stenotrophomonas rhizophila]MCC7635987.1 autotransporter outer membrane beta-barrel domain-containing protein [Stenotrophomonas rhizophila]MCC7665328.1 autotransporter outer membrane beta-barrel domain-containing protein [Stenotrophomonas rhizophila]
MKQSVLSVALAGVLGVLAVGAAGDAAAMNYHVRGDRVYLSGGVTYADVMSLPALLAKAQAEGRPIREVVLRTSNGGALIAGEWLQGVIRTAGLNTIVSGHCISSCSIMQSGGVERYLGGDLPIVDSVQIHAASSGGKVIYTPSARMTQIYAGNYGGGMDAGLLHKAMYEVVQPNGLLVFSDPARATGAPVSFDPDGSGSKRETFPGQDIFSNNIVTAAGYRDPGDTLNVAANVTGDINPAYLRTGRQLQALVDDDFARWNTNAGSTYMTVAQAIYNLSGQGPQNIGTDSVQDYLNDPGIQALLLSRLRLGDLDASTLDDAMGVIRVTNGATWRTAATTGADFMLVDNGTIALEGGALRASEVRVMAAGMLVGHGDVAGTGMDFDALANGTGPSWREDGFNRLRVFGTLMPRGGDLVTHGYVNIMPGGKVLFDVTENGGSAGGRLRVGSFFDDGQNDGALVIAKGAYLELNVAQGFYGTDYRRDLVQGPIYQQGFQDVVRLGDTGYTANLANGDVFRPRHNSLLSFNVQQTADGLWLTANPGFEQIGLFTSATAGDGLGRALASAADGNNAALRPLLGALQFADRDIIQQQAGSLRGDAHATLRLADTALVGSIGNVVQQHQFSLRSSGGDAGGLAMQAAQAASAQPGMANASLFNQLAMHLVAPSGETADASGDSGRRNLGVWGRGFGSQGRIEGGDGVAGMTHTVGGIVLGADTRIADDRVTLGVSVAAADMSTKGRDGSEFSGDVRALDVGGYLDASYARGFLSFAARYTDLRHDTRRSITGIAGLDSPLRAKYSNDAVSARLEHGFTFTTGNGLVIQPLLPVVDYARTSATRFDEGQGAGALTGRSDSLESIRVGAGLQLYKTFAGRNGERITPHARVVWQKELGDSRAQYSNAFSAAPELVFGAASQQVGERVLAWNVGVTSRASERLSIMLDYVGQRRDGQDQNGVMLGLGYRF